jgi:hypothetical protein
MPAIPITSDEQYEEAIEVLTRVGGSYLGVGLEERFLLISATQYQALVKANVVTLQNSNKDPKGGRNSRKSAKP